MKIGQGWAPEVEKTIHQKLAEDLLRECLSRIFKSLNPNSALKARGNYK